MTIADEIKQRKPPSGIYAEIGIEGLFVRNFERTYSFPAPGENTVVQAFYVYPLENLPVKYSIVPNPEQYEDDAWPENVSFSHARSLATEDMNTVDPVTFPTPGTVFGVLVEVGFSYLAALIAPADFDLNIDLMFLKQTDELSTFVPAPPPP